MLEPQKLRRIFSFYIKYKDWLCRTNRYSRNTDLRTLEPKPYVQYFPGTIDQNNISVKAHIDGGPPLIIDHVATTHPFACQKSYDPDDPANIYDFGVTKRVPLG